MVHDFGKTLERFKKADAVNGHSRPKDYLKTIEGGADSMVAEWKELNPDMVILAFKKYLIQTGSLYNIVRIT